MIDVAVPLTVGALIGYVTNWLAIKMLFWPRGEKRVLGIRVPFTPGLFVRRRRDFSKSVSALVEKRFITAEDLYALVKRAEKDGVLDKVMSNMGAGFRIASHMYFRRTTRDSFYRDCRRVAVGVRRSRVVSTAVRNNLDAMSVEEIETMIFSVVERELRAITWLGAVIGAFIGAIQLFR